VTDVVCPEVRSRMMSGIRSKDTKPELAIRKGIFARGFRYRLHVRELPGKPDMVLPKHRAIIFVNGCFWHGHNCALFKWPSTRVNFWRTKINRNRIVDAAAKSKLSGLGWRVLTVWECALKGKGREGPEAISKAIAEWLAAGDSLYEIRGIVGKA